ncbi:DUF2290 domain-containing protein [Lysinibacillus sp. 3P01SB]|uniref:DUF2290 domain-containing protein n=1 Tax=Lysinibacillus sp. 3P01SB TaxID=3132284 RepID=UPI0039A48018
MCSKKIIIGAEETKKEIDEIIIQLIGAGLSINQNFTSIRNVGKNKIVSWGEAKDLSIVLKNIDYEDIYNTLEQDENYTIKLIDGSLIQMMYKFDSRNNISSHRLGFFPCINLKPLEEDHELYSKFDLYADILKKNTLPTIFRFDFDVDSKLYVEMDHAKSHVTFGQFESCRIPSSGPITPKKFIDFVIRNFYHSAMKDLGLDFNSSNNFNRTISSNEEKLLHFNF